MIANDKSYKLVEVFNSIKGEGTQAGIPMTFVRFSHCNLDCSWCDTPYNRVALNLGRKELLAHILDQHPVWVVFTGGEPCLQLDPPLTQALKAAGIKMAIETNGMVWTNALTWIDYINISPKWWHPVDKQVLGLRAIHEVRYTLGDGQPDIWRIDTGEFHGYGDLNEIHTVAQLIGVEADAITISPLMDEPYVLPEGWKSGDGYNSMHGKVNQASFNKCLHLVNKYKRFGARLSVQVHKFVGVR